MTLLTKQSQLCQHLNDTSFFVIFSWSISVISFELLIPISVIQCSNHYCLHWLPQQHFSLQFLLVPRSGRIWTTDLKSSSSVIYPMCCHHWPLQCCFFLCHFLLLNSGSLIWTFDLSMSCPMFYHCAKNTFSHQFLLVLSSSWIWTSNLRISSWVIYSLCYYQPSLATSITLILSIFCWCHEVVGFEPLISISVVESSTHCAANTCDSNAAFFFAIFSW